MIKKIICGALVVACAFAFAACGCSSDSSDDSTVETQPEALKEIADDIQTGEYAYYIPTYDWLNEETGDTIDFDDSGTFRGIVNGKTYSGKFTLEKDKKMLGRVNSNVTLADESSVKWTIDFKNTVEIYITTADGNREYFAAKWWLDEKSDHKKAEVTDSFKITETTPAGYYYEYLAQGWVNNDSKDTLKFNIDGSFEGKIASKKQSGNYTISLDSSKPQDLKITVLPSGKVYKAQFDSSSKLKVTTDKKKSESYVAEWTTKK